MSPRFTRFLFPLAMGLIALSFSSCASTRAKTAPDAGSATAPVEAPLPEEKKIRPIGTISMVNEDLAFVLIEAKELLPENTPLKTVNASGLQTSKLLVSAEKQPPFLIADIVEGNPFAGDQVIVSP